MGIPAKEEGTTAEGFSMNSTPKQIESSIERSSGLHHLGATTQIVVSHSTAGDGVSVSTTVNGTAEYTTQTEFCSIECSPGLTHRMCKHYHLGAGDGFAVNSISRIFVKVLNDCYPV